MYPINYCLSVQYSIVNSHCTQISRTVSSDMIVTLIIVSQLLCPLFPPTSGHHILLSISIGLDTSYQGKSYRLCFSVIALFRLAYCP